MILTELRALHAGMDALAALARQYEPVARKAAALVDSPGARVARIWNGTGRGRN